MLYRLLDFYIVASRFYHRFWKTTYCFQVNALTMIGRSYTPNTGDRRHLAPFWVNEQLFNGVRQLDSSPYQYPKPPSMSQSVKRLGRCTASLRRTRVPWPFRSPSCCTMGPLSNRLLRHLGLLASPGCLLDPCMLLEP